MRIAVLAGGVGGARFVRALTEGVDPRDVTVLATVGDDLEVLGLHVSPDLDSILYALAGLGDEVGPDRPIAVVHARDKLSAEAVAGRLRHAYRLGDVPPPPADPVVERIYAQP